MNWFDYFLWGLNALAVVLTLWLVKDGKVLSALDVAGVAICGGVVSIYTYLWLKG